MSDRTKSNGDTPARQAKTARKHYNRALAESVWCCRHVSKLLDLGQVPSGATYRSLCGKHWDRMWKDWAAFARLCRMRAQTEHDAGHVIVAAILRGIAKKITRPRAHPFQALEEARELMGWIPSDPSSTEDSQYWAVETVTRLPVLDPSTKRSLIGEVLSKPGRPSDTRRIATYAMEMRLLGESWSEIEKKFLVHRRNVRNPGASVRREVQLLKSVLKRHGILT